MPRHVPAQSCLRRKDSYKRRRRENEKEEEEEEKEDVEEREYTMPEDSLLDWKIWIRRDDHMIQHLTTRRIGSTLSVEYHYLPELVCNMHVVCI